MWSRPRPDLRAMRDAWCAAWNGTSRQHTFVALADKASAIRVSLAWRDEYATRCGTCREGERGRKYDNERLSDDGEGPERHVVEQCGRLELRDLRRGLRGSSLRCHHWADIFHRTGAVFFFPPFLWHSHDHERRLLQLVGMTNVRECLLLRCCKLLYYCNHHGVITVGVWITQRDTCVRFLPRKFHSPLSTGLVESRWDGLVLSIERLRICQSHLWQSFFILPTS